MPKSVVINLGTGDLYHGLPRVTAQIRSPSDPAQAIGSLPAAPRLVELYRDWRSLYLSLCDRRPLRSGAPLNQEAMLEIDDSGITNISQVSFEQLSQNLQAALNTWLSSSSFLPIERQLRSHFSPTEAVQVVIETDDDLLRRLPWQRWEFFQDYPQAEMALSCSAYQARPVTARPARKTARILAVLGKRQDIDLALDAQSLQQLPNAETKILVNPSRQEFNQHLWDESGWDLLFFAGHSQTEGETGRIYINDRPPHDSLTIAQFEAAIAGAVSNGLQLAIFNSCDGLGLATALSRLHIPQVIVMREPVPNRVAQEFFKYFLDAFVHQRLSLYRAVRQARQQLQGLEDEFPGASWLPVLGQNPAVAAPTWQDWSLPPSVQSQPPKGRAVGTILLLSLLVTGCVALVRGLGWLQTWELQAFDQLLRLRSPELPDPRLLIVTITEADLHLPEQAERKGSLSDLALTKLLQQLTPFQPRAIGLDVYRDFPLPPNTPLAAALQQQPNFFAICKVADPQADFPEIEPFPQLPSDRQGFSDVVTDADDVLRRHLLLMNSTPGAACNTPFALSTQLAWHYLKQEGITPNYTAQGQLQLGDRGFPRLHGHQGGYQQTDTAGYQILLNYRFVESSLSPAATVTLKDALAGRLQMEDVRDRIVLIGVTAPSSKDYLKTPYGQKVPGVLIQAQMVSQLISAVKDGRDPISVWFWPVELLWIGGWSLWSGFVTWRWRSTPRWLGLQVMGLGALVICCFYGLTQSLWVPLVPAALGSWLTSAGVQVLIKRQGIQPSTPKSVV